MNNPFLDLSNWIVVIVTLLLVYLCVVFHVTVLGTADRLLRNANLAPKRRMSLLILTFLFAHIAEIWLFAFGYYLLLRFPSLGGLTGVVFAGLPECVYFSAVVYSTLGFGDMVPHGAIRFMTGMEAVVGLVLIAWSAAYAYAEIQRHWKLY